MNTRILGKTGTTVSELGLGTEYLLNTSRETVQEVVRTAVDHGVTYLDFFYAQPDIRDWMRTALCGIRERVVLAGHFGAAEEDGQYRKSHDLAESRRYFDDLLLRLDTDYVDVLILHNADSKEDTERALGPCLEQVLMYQEQGKARHIGFSGHTPESALAAAESGVVDVLMYPVHVGQHGEEGLGRVLSACAEHEVGVVAMKPFAGGKLLQGERLLGATPVALLAYSLSRLAVSTTVPGPKDVRELRECLEYIGAAPERRDFSDVLQAARPQGGKATCVYCNHCLPCPSGIDIGAVSRILDACEAGQREWAERESRRLTVLPSACIQCAGCRERCPWQIDSPARIRRAAELLAIAGDRSELEQRRSRTD